jgi:RNA polymerase sigma-70 factor (ECF subfamily)
MDRTEIFNQYRPLLFSIAYRMLGSVMEAEDMVQETFLRWQQVSEDEIESPKAYLTTIVTRLCIDFLRSARARREEYVGPWLPEPLVTGEPAAGGDMTLADSLSMAFLVLLESLNPVERAVFLLRDVFDYDYAEIARIVGKSEANCRQMARRARQYIAARRPRFNASPEQQERLLLQFLETSTNGDVPGLVELLADDITLWADGGGKARAALKPIRGALNVARFVVGVVRTLPRDMVTRRVEINGQPGIIAYEGDRVIGVAVLDVGDGRIRGIGFIVNPEKLQGLLHLSGDGER